VDHGIERSHVLLHVQVRPRLLQARLLRRLLSRERVVLFLCVENAGRSLMAEAMFNAVRAPGWRAESAGTRPAAAPNPRTTRMLEEIGLTLPSHPPRAMTDAMLATADVVVSMGCLDDASCPANLRRRELTDWALPDPARLDDAGFRSVRDAIRVRVQALAEQLARTTGPSAPA
jgi:arsenate reductase